MSRSPGLGKPLLAAALCLLLGGEQLLPDQPAPRPPRTAAIIPIPDDTAASDSEMGLWAQTALARPLFKTNRRPPRIAGSHTRTELPRLSAIIVSGGTSRAIFTGPGPLPKVVSEGGQIADYDIEAILPDAVKLAGTGGELTLRPQFSNAAPDDASASAPGIASKNPPPPPPPIRTPASRFDDDPI